MPYQMVEKCSIFYEDIGIGDPVLFLHSGYSRGILAFGGQIQPFSNAYRCLLPDFRGHGRTRCECLDWDTPLLARDMEEFLKSLRIEKAHLIGYSLGGGVALHLAAEHPERVKSLITIGTCGMADAAGADEYEPEALIQRGETNMIRRMKALHAEAHGGNWQHFMRQSAKDWRRYPCLLDKDWEKLAMPLLFIGGENDPYASPQQLQDMRTKCPHAEIWSVPGAKHRPHMPMEQVRAVNERMLMFLESL